MQNSSQGSYIVGRRGHDPDMWQPFLGREAITAGRLTRGQLRWNHTAVHPGVYLPNDAERTLYLTLLRPGSGPAAKA